MKKAIALGAIALMTAVNMAPVQANAAGVNYNSNSKYTCIQSSDLNGLQNYITTASQQGCSTNLQDQLAQYYQSGGTQQSSVIKIYGNLNNAACANTGNAGSTNTGNSGTKNTGNTNTGNTNTGSTGCTNTGNGTSTNTGNSTSTTTGNTGTTNTGNTSTGSKGSTTTGSTGSTTTGSKGSTTTGNTGSTSTGTSNTGSTGTTTGSTGTTAQAEKSYAEQVVDLVNQERAKEGLTALKIDTNLQKAATVRAKEIQTSFAHTRPDGTSFSTVLKENGVSYSGAGENIAWGQQTPEEVVNAWMNSPGHRANIMNKQYKYIGVGNLQNSAGRQYWVQLFTY